MIATCLSIITLSIHPFTSVFSLLAVLVLYITVAIKKYRFRTLLMIPEDTWIYLSVFVFFSMIANFLVSEVVYAVYLHGYYYFPWKLITTN